MRLFTTIAITLSFLLFGFGCNDEACDSAAEDTACDDDDSAADDDDSAGDDDDSAE